MKHLACSLALGFAAVTVTLAEPPPAPSNPPPSAPAGKPEKPRDRLQKMKTDLGLTDDQAAKVGQIMQDNRGAMREIKDDPSLTKEQKMEKAKQLRAGVDAKMAAILTPEQKAKWDEMKKNRPEKPAKPEAP
jgi:Spy/CpxP family protein refolding chaperone